ncbi:hypothetical protein [Metabacillus niabensis]|uniref:ABC-type iron transport system FetAB permease component n=1 Tax=Metabacillus niabensis TaxID=324854 RepID=A0ABT9Z1A5_9BACI|nr:hypothetical protein [Metabacillus niabensis]MDQ0226029.1 ABC-type iron transport system FetAB permease component [Metabacillus niabensis]PAD67273.1 hypothetical protein CHH83_19485 [Bacillus sp. 7586-K]
MAFTSFIMLFVVCLAFLFFVVGVTLYKKKKTTNKPSILGVCSLLLQLILFVLFFSGILEKFNETVANIYWLGTIIFGLVVGVKEIKRNIIISLASIFLSILLAILMFLMLLITSM